SKTENGLPQSMQPLLPFSRRRRNPNLERFPGQAGAQILRAQERRACPQTYTRRRTKEAMRAADPIDAIPDRCHAQADQVEVVRKLAATMTITNVLRQTGLSIYLLRKMALAHSFEFVPFNPSANLVPKQTDPIADAMNAVRIKAARDNGISRKAAVTELGLSNTLINRLIRHFKIDYPLKGPSRKLGACSDAPILKNI
ncbi:hypothetical protein, partial [Pseudomonas congelans]|uniref:hypothetical protein n=1 Tax=Pseudomonas congelans TaxID=200452 RepID=UPI001EFE3253